MRHALLFLTLATVLAACATGTGMTRQERLDLYRQHAGPPIGSFRLDRNWTHNWTPLGDQALAIWTTGNRGHLIELRSRCFGLGSAHRVSLTNSVGQVVSRMDSVVPRSAAGTSVSMSARACRIDTIREIDRRSLRDAKREMREAEAIDRSQAPPDVDEAPATQP